MFTDCVIKKKKKEANTLNAGVVMDTTELYNLILN